jgi:predicted RNA-binding Zn-ribbon protein involved in translation (DUF1610 family)
MKKWNKEEIIKFCKSSYSYNEVLIKMGRNNSSSNYNSLKRNIVKYNIDVSHFLNKSELTKKMHNDGRLNKKRNDEIFCTDSNVKRDTVKRRILEENLIDYKCKICGTNPIWRNKTLVLILDHINGVRNDNRLANLRFVCPNCNSQLDTHCKRI